MKFVAPWLYYSVLRVLMFAVPLTILLAMGFWPWAAAVIAALLGVCLSYLFLGKSREAVARDLYKARHPDQEPVNLDSEIEDSALNGAESTSAESTSAESTSAESTGTESTSAESTGSEREGKSQ